MIQQGSIPVIWDNCSYKEYTFTTKTDYKDAIEIVRHEDKIIYKDNLKLDHYTCENLLEGFLDLKIFPKFKDPVGAVHRMLPGYILPFHYDKYPKYKNSFKIEDIENIVRLIVFLEDYQDGHILEISGHPIKNWKAGDWVSWSGTAHHLAANLGKNNRYTLQITAHV